MRTVKHSSNIVTRPKYQFFIHTEGIFKGEQRKEVARKN